MQEETPTNPLEMVLVFLVKDNHILMARKTKKIGIGCWNGYGGRIEAGETELEACAREIKEESSLTIFPADLVKVALVDVRNEKEDGSHFDCRIHSYITNSWQGEVVASSEMIEPTWFPISELPLSNMMPADKVWVPLVVKGKKVIVSAHYSPFQKELIGEVQIQEVSKFD